ncbi:hypothetical protein RYX36_013510 [Vicia faba]
MDDRDKSDRRNRDRHSERDRDHKHHRTRHDSDDHRHHRSDRNAKHEHKTKDREGSRYRSKVKRDEEMEDSVEPRHSPHSHKRKYREHSDDRDLEDKRIRVSEEKREVKKELRKFGDKVKKDEDYDSEPKIKEEVTNGAHGFASSKDNASVHNGVAAGSPAVVHASVPQTSLPPPPPIPIKVSSISTTNENKGVSITMSHEVTGKSSTDGSSSTAGKPGSLSIDALAKAKKALQMQKELPEKLKRIPQIVTPDGAIPRKPTKAPVLRLDAQGREIDEHGNVVNVTKPSNLSTLKVNINKQKKDAFEILKPVLEVDPESNPHFDERMGIDKTKLLRPKRMNILFVEEGKWSRDAESIKLKSKYGEAQAKEQKAKQAQLAKAKAAPDINPNLIDITERVVFKEKLKDQIPEIEWWDVALLHSGNYGDIANGTVGEDKLKMEKITFYVEHPRPIEPPAEPAPPPPQPLKLTKQEQKKLRTQRRMAKEKERQELIRQGVIEPPKPKVKMSNLMKVLGTEATQDPTRLEKEVRNAAAEREQAHIDRNIARKLTPAELREKKERRLFDDPNTLDTLVSLYRINDLSHPKARFKLDVNAQENRLTGCSVICAGISVVVVEGGSKSIKRYGKLMLRRINWSDFSKEKEEDEDSDDDKPVNKCVLVWQGSIAKPSFNRFSVHDCIPEAAARKVFVDAGVPHYWDQAVNYVDDEASSIVF